MNRRPTTSEAPNSPTALEAFVDVIEGSHIVPPLSEHGTDRLRACLGAIAPHMPAIVIHAQWVEWTGGPVAEAIDAAHAAERGDDRDVDPEDEATELRTAIYYTGLLVGMALADSLRGAIATREGLRGRR